MHFFRAFLLCGLAVLLTGCTEGGEQDPAPLYEAVLKHEFPGKGKDEVVFLFIDGKDPAPDLLKRLRQQWPNLQPGSKVPQGQATRIDLGELKTAGDSAELRVAVSNGIDGRLLRFWLSRKGGTWVVEKTKLEAQS
jgi:hypothetical protein